MAWRTSLTTTEAVPYGCIVGVGWGEFHLLGVGLVEDAESILGRFVPPGDDALETVLEALEDAAEEAAISLVAAVVALMIGSALLRRRRSTLVASEAEEVVQVVVLVAVVVAGADAAAREGETAEREAASESEVPKLIKG